MVVTLGVHTKRTVLCVSNRRLAKILYKGPGIKYSGLADYMVSTATTPANSAQT